jgi:L-threonylcarbamoyladenylate synthase
MRVLRVDGAAPDPEAVAEAAAALRRGSLIIFPTDTLYALGALALSGDSVASLRAAKRREDGKPLPLVAADVEQACGLWSEFPPAAEALAARFWPGPLTLVLQASAAVPRAVTAGAGTVAVRVPALELTRRLAREAGPLVATSANLAGKEPPLTCAAAVLALGGVAAVALDSGPGGAVPSTIVDLTGEAPRLVREGAVPWAQILAVLRGGAA